MKKKILGLLLILVITFGVTACGDNGKSNNSNKENNAATKNSKYKLGDTFEFDGLQFKLASTYSFAKIENEFSDYNGKDVIKIGVTVKNVSKEKHSLNMFYYDLFGSKGTELDIITAYFDDAIDYAGDLKPDASYDTNFYILYDGDGKYSIDFDNFTNKLSVEFDITK